ncbi:hypothetical protein BAMY6639_13915 [Bacillus amyloliquefaciens UMAF6639]|nr:hypothetical protein BAMY6639_13915 [Bacillus amyloliquefaciens UMAF6639]
MKNFVYLFDFLYLLIRIQTTTEISSTGYEIMDAFKQANHRQLNLGKSVKFSLMMLLRIVDGKIIEHRSHVDVHDILRQLGVN